MHVFALALLMIAGPDSAAAPGSVITTWAVDTCGAVPATLNLTLVAGDAVLPAGTVITLTATATYSYVVHTNSFVSNGRRPVFVCSGDVELAGQQIKWIQQGQVMCGIWLTGHLIGLADGGIVSDSCLPRWPAWPAPTFAGTSVPANTAPPPPPKTE